MPTIWQGDTVDTPDGPGTVTDRDTYAGQAGVWRRTGHVARSLVPGRGRDRDRFRPGRMGVVRGSADVRMQRRAGE